MANLYRQTVTVTYSDGTSQNIDRRVISMRFVRQRRWRERSGAEITAVPHFD